MCLHLELILMMRWRDFDGSEREACRMEEQRTEDRQKIPGRGASSWTFLDILIFFRRALHEGRCALLIRKGSTGKSRPGQMHSRAPTWVVDMKQDYL